MSLTRGPLKEPLQGSQQGLLTAEGERGAVGLAIVIQVPLVALQDRQRDVLGMDQVPLIAPGDEALQSTPSGFDRLSAQTMYRRPLREALCVGVQRIAVRGGRCAGLHPATVFGSKHWPSP